MSSVTVRSDEPSGRGQRLALPLGPSAASAHATRYAEEEFTTAHGGRVGNKMTGGLFTSLPVICFATGLTPPTLPNGTATPGRSMCHNP